MAMAGPGLERYRLALLAAREDVGNPRAGTDWAVFGYEKHHDLKLLDSGAGGPDELAGKFSAGSVMYGLCRVRDPGSGSPRIVLISWVGEKVPEPQRAACAGHLPAIRSFFREATAVISARRAEEGTLEGLRRVLAQLQPPAPRPPRRTPQDTPELVGTNYRKTNPALELQRTQRDSFWEQAEREEQQRKEQERQREREQRRRWERERMEEERLQAAERERRLQERERLIEERRQEQARLDAEERRKEQERWEQQQREQEAAERERGARTGLSGTAAEAAILVSQRAQNPREFFRQRERSGSTSASPVPGSAPGARRPFLRYQRSLTESAFIFRRPEPLQSPPPGAPRGAPPPSPRRPPPPLPPGPAGTGTPRSATSGTPASPTGRDTPPSASLGTPPSPARAGSPHATSPAGTGTPECGTLGTPPSPARAGSPLATSPAGTGTPECGTLGNPPSPAGTGTPQSATTGTLHTPLGTGTPPSAPPGSPPRIGFALLLARDAPHPPLLGGPSPPTEDEDLSPHAV
ncbi:drebrin-like [Passer montanus]|uniref:drebrin-like n=1 Tax=Passer montanus TaxID=9160 RepID=UPI001961E37F|nr:drebrin-like [Passer montanus]